jgi:hypothetical protein
MRRSILAAVTIVSLLLAMSATTALAAPPANDDFASRTVIGSLPFTDTVDATEATADPTDPIGCGGPDVPTVWYEFTPSADIRVAATMEASEFPAGINVWVGDPADPANLLFVDCGLPGIAWDAFAGETYFLMVTPPIAGDPIGTLVITAEEAPPPIELGLTIDPTGSVRPKTGTVEIRGTLTCSAPTFAGVDVFVEQRNGRALIQGGGFTEVECDGTTPFSVTVTGFNGLFTGGKATVQASAIACDEFGCSFADAFANVKLTGRR